MALRERLCGCSHVYVWEISNDERMPFQVWARGASAQCSTLFTIRTHTHAHPSLLHTLMHVCVRTYMYIGIYTCRGICNFVINPPHLVLYSRHLFTSLQDCRNIAFKSTSDSDSVVSQGPGSYSYCMRKLHDTSPSSNPNE